MEDVVDLARIEGKKLRPISCVEDLNQALPYLKVVRDMDNNYKTTGHNYEQHPNASRMEFLQSYLEHKVLPFVKGNLSGYFNVELHDVYDPIKTVFDNCLVWSKQKGDDHVVLMPDLYNLIDYHGQLRVTDQSSWVSKRDKMCFFGSSTGSTILNENERVKGCTWGCSHADIADFFITRKVQMAADVRIPLHIMCPPVGLHEMFNYKVCCDIKGNTNCWDRLPIVLNSRSLLFQLPSEFMSFYEPILVSSKLGKKMVHVESYDDLPGKLKYYLTNPKEAIQITRDANAFANTYLNSHVAQHYFVTMMQSHVDNNTS